MIAIVTNKQDHTADFLIVELQRRGAAYFRLNTEDFAQHTICWSVPLSEANYIVLRTGRKIPLAEISCVWYRRPYPPRVDCADGAAVQFSTGENQAALDGFLVSLTDCMWVSEPHMIRRAELKMLQLRVAESLGFTLCPSVITNSPTEAQRFVMSASDVVIYKPLRSARIISGESVALIYTNIVSEADEAELVHLAGCPVLLQYYAQKAVELRITVIGDKVFAVALHSQESHGAQVDWRRVNASELQHSKHILPSEIEALCIRLVSTLGLQFGAIDMILTPGGEYVFLEINPNGQWAWLQQLLPSLPLRESLADLLQSRSPART
ncbi:MAG: hypothetical protein IPJ58_19125 [Ardenticatenia bacterium]|nr:hypothetical protein [Ardenticatenia bacterium]